MKKDKMLRIIPRAITITRTLTVHSYLLAMTMIVNKWIIWSKGTMLLAFVCQPNLHKNEEM